MVTGRRRRILRRMRLQAMEIGRGRSGIPPRRRIGWRLTLESAVDLVIGLRGLEDGRGDAAQFGKIDEDIRKRQEIVAKLAQKHDAALVRFQRIFDEAARRAPADYWIWDNVHPTYRGHQLMADEWERVVREFWK